MWLVNKMIWFCSLYYIGVLYAKTAVETAIVFVFWGLNQGTFWDNGKKLEHLDLACSMYLMRVFIFISIDSCICDLEKGLSNYSNWSLPEKAVENSKHFAFSFLLVCELPCWRKSVREVTKTDKVDLKEKHSDKKLLEMFWFWENFLFNGSSLNSFWKETRTMLFRMYWKNSRINLKMCGDESEGRWKAPPIPWWGQWFD